MTSPDPTPEPIDVGLARAGPDALPRTAWLRIDLDAIVANLGAIRGAVGPGVRVEPVVKADAYGHGLVEVGRALEAGGADGFSVATIDEALVLRAAGIRRPILVLYPIPVEQAAIAARRRVAVAVGGGPLLERLLADRASAVSAGTPPRRPRRLEVQLEVETGLGRGGVPEAEVVRTVRAIRACPGVRLTGLWSHLAAPPDAERTAAQVARFEAAAAALRDAGIAPPARHLAATGGLLAGVAAFDAVRPGLAIYGLVPESLAPAAIDGDLARALRPAMSLHARPIRVIDLPAGHGVSYGPTHVTAGPARIATLPLGYGDGWARNRSNRAEALVRGHRVPLVGNVTMDAVMVDVSSVPGRPVDVDDEFVLLGRQGDESITAADLARAGTTISWEIVTAMAARLPRVYDAAARPRTVRTLLSRS